MGRNFVQRAAKFRLAFACRRTSLEEIALLANEALFGVMTSINECVEYAPIGQLDRIVEGDQAPICHWSSTMICSLAA